MQGVVLAAGKGTRLAPLTPARSKAMAPVAGLPLVHRVIDSLAAAGVDELVVVTSPDDTRLRAYLDAELAPQRPVRSVIQSEPLGMAHALRLAAPWLDRSFVMSACDNLVPPAHLAELVAVHAAREADATLSLMPVRRDQVHRTGVVVWDEPWVREIVEKPAPAAAPSTISSLPLYAFSPTILSLIEGVRPSPRGEYELQDAIQALIDQGGRVTGCFTPERRQVTDLADLLALNLAYLVESGDTIVESGAEIGEDVTLTPPVFVERGARVGDAAVLGPCVYVEAGAQIGARAQVSEAIVLGHAVVGADTQAHGRVVLAE